MAHPVLDEIMRAKFPIRPDVFRRWQNAIRDEIIPAMEKAEEPAKPAKGKAA